MSKAHDDGGSQVDGYLDALVPPHHDTLVRLRATLRKVLPEAEECLRYGMPAFTVDGKGVAAYGAFKEHCSYFPMSSAVLTAAGRALDGYTQSKGGLRFPADRPLPVGIVRTLVKLRLAELSSVVDGTRIEYFDDGRRKAVGTMKDGELHGVWTWYRRDGTVLRAGRFANGRRVGA